MRLGLTEPFRSLFIFLSMHTRSQTFLERPERLTPKLPTPRAARKVAEMRPAAPRCAHAAASAASAWHTLAARRKPALETLGSLLLKCALSSNRKQRAEKTTSAVQLRS